MAKLTIERRGGLAGLTARGEVDLARLDAADQASVEALFSHRPKGPPAPGGDRYIYRLSRDGSKGSQTVEVPEAEMPIFLTGAVKDSLP